jgi:uncharacterized protein YecE (DUF72 family)
MQISVGTSGWYYEWNPDRTLDWYIRNSGLNAIELNASFYRFPYPNQVKSWARKGAPLAWAVKVNRSVTHTHRFNEDAIAVWRRFRDAFAPMDSLIRFYLFQAPPGFADAGRIIRFAGELDLGGRFALEIRNKKVLADEGICRSLQDHVTLVSVDSPDARNRIFPGDILYMRFHGRTGWYSHDYSDAELGEAAALIRESAPREVAVFFNNNHAMLENARRMRDLMARGEGMAQAV